MEKWKIAVIAALLLGLLAFGLTQQNATPPGLTPSALSSTPTPSPFIGKSLPPWSFKQWNGQPVSQESLKGGVSLVEIFRIDCSHCQAATPMMVDIHKIYGPRGLKMVAIQSPADLKTPTNPERDWSKVQPWLTKHGITYPVAFDQESKYYQGDIKNEFYGGDDKLLTYPILLLIGPDGKVIWTQVGHDTDRAINLAIELENHFPGPGTKAQRVQTVMKWLKSLKDVAEDLSYPNVTESVTGTITKRLK